jgi:hypothetical protein
MQKTSQTYIANNTPIHFHSSQKNILTKKRIVDQAFPSRTPSRCVSTGITNTLAAEIEYLSTGRSATTIAGTATATVDTRNISSSEELVVAASEEIYSMASAIVCGIFSDKLYHVEFETTLASSSIETSRLALGGTYSITA